MKTVETWLINYKQGIDEEIYCDFEDDIFQKNLFEETATFRQIKLYSSKFSFSSEEITKCIAHFFMLHVKTDYSSLDKEFIFETNSSISRKRRNNDAELLKMWFENQDNLEDELLQKCVSKVKEVVSLYIQEQIDSSKGKEEEDLVKEAKEAYDSLDEDFWIEFTKKIKWRFKNIPPDIEFASLKENIESLILSLPFSIDKKDISNTFGLLHNTAWEKATSKNIENRKLTLKELKNTLLKSADEKDKWYWKVFEKWNVISTIEYFTIGEFYEAIDAARHCREHPYLHVHGEKWKEILKTYIESVEMTNFFRRAAIYEYLWLRLKPTDNYSSVEGDLFGEEKYYDDYFNDFRDFKNAKELEDIHSLLDISFAAIIFGKTDITKDKIVTWRKQLEQTLLERLKKEKNPNEICSMFEVLGTLYLTNNIYDIEEVAVNKISEPFEQVIEISGQASFYNLSLFSKRLNDYIRILIETRADEKIDIIECLESLVKKLTPLIDQREGAFKVAKNEIEKGIQYLTQGNPVQLLRTLNYFHKAKTLWHKQEYIEGFVIALLNIAQIYLAIGMNLAAKYYALSAAWMSIHNGKTQLLKRIADALAFVFFSDYKQGAWMNAIVSYENYIYSHENFKSQHNDPEIDDLPFKTMAEMSILLYSIPRLSPELKVLIESKIKTIGEELLQFLFSKLNENFESEDNFKILLEEHLLDNPLNDLGKKRSVRFDSLGTTWELSFENEYELNLIAEEFCSIIQIILAEIALSKNDFHLIKGGTIRLELEISSTDSIPQQLPSNKDLKWKVFLEKTDTPDHNEIILHNAKFATIFRFMLSEISLLKDDEFNDLYDRLYKENDLAGKTLILGSYQRMYRYFFKKPNFDELYRQHFQPIGLISEKLPKSNPVMEWKSELSRKYNQQQAIQYIKNRFASSNKCIYLTVEKLKKEINFKKFINDLRNEGFHDWQITLAMMNFMLQYKTRLKLEKEKIDDNDDFEKRYNEVFFAFLNTDEKDCYIEFPLEAFESWEFKLNIKETGINVLKSFGLQNGAKFPNFSAVKEFLDIRFNMRNDIETEGSLLKDI